MPLTPICTLPATILPALTPLALQSSWAFPGWQLSTPFSKPFQLLSGDPTSHAEGSITVLPHARLHQTRWPTRKNKVFSWCSPICFVSKQQGQKNNHSLQAALELFLCYQSSCHDNICKATPPPPQHPHCKPQIQLIKNQAHPHPNKHRSTSLCLLGAKC